MQLKDNKHYIQNMIGITSITVNKKIFFSNKSPKTICHAEAQWMLCQTALTGNVVDVCYGAVLCSINKTKTVCRSPIF